MLRKCLQHRITCVIPGPCVKVPWCAASVHFCCEFSLTLQDSVVPSLCTVVSSQWPISPPEWPIGPYSIQFATIVSFVPPQDPIVPSQCPILPFPVPYCVTKIPYFAIMPLLCPVVPYSQYPVLPSQCAIMTFLGPILPSHFPVVHICAVI